MTNEEVIRKAVEYAEHWEFYSSDYHESGGEVIPPYGGCWWLYELPSMFLDALAAQLVRQIERTREVYIGPRTVEIRTSIGNRCDVTAERPDRTMNTLRACVAFFDSQEREA